jgi:hypothetical protein
MDKIETLFIFYVCTGAAYIFCTRVLFVCTEVHYWPSLLVMKHAYWTDVLRCWPQHCATVYNLLRTLKQKEMPVMQI